MTDMSKFEEANLPSKAKFFNQLNEEPISDDDYIHAQNVWDTFKCHTLRDFHDIYLKADVDVLES